MCRVDLDYLSRVVGDIRQGLSESIVLMGRDRFARSVRARFSLRYAIIFVVESASDIATSILEKCFSVEAESYRDCFVKLAEHGVITVETAEMMASLASLRNIVIHKCWTIDDLRIYDEASRSGVESIKNFIREVEEFAARDP